MPLTWSTPNSTRRPYPPELRRRAVELARTRDLPPAQLARDLAVDRKTLQHWLQHAEVDAGRRDGMTTDETAELARLRREVRMLREARASRKQAARCFARESMP